jgi:molybdate ABC transporter, permease protein
MFISPILISMKTAAVSIVITFFIGTFIAKIIADLKSERAKAIWDGIFTLPLVLPPTVVGFFLLYIFGVKRPIGRFFLEYFGIKIAFSWGATIIAAVVISLPLMYRSARGAFEQVDENLIYAGRTLGLSEGKIFWKILFPNALPGIVSGAVLAFARGLGEFGATAMIAGNILYKTRTLPLAVYSSVAAGDMNTAYKYVAIITMISFVIMLVMNYFASKERKRRKA